MSSGNDYDWHEIIYDLSHNRSIDDPTSWKREQLLEGYRLLAKLSPSQAVNLSNRYDVPFELDDDETPDEARKGSV